MARVQIIVDEQSMFDAEVEGWESPPMLRKAPRPDFGPVATIPASVKPLLLLAVGKAMEKALSEGTFIQPVTVQLSNRHTGFTLSVDLND